MALPKITAPTYELNLPSTNKTVKFRPFLVREEKILMLASESEDAKEIANAMKTVIKNCVVTRLKVEDLCSFDIEYLFLNIRGKSVGEELTISMICPDDNETQGTVTVNVDEIKVNFPEGHTNEIDLGDDLSIIMKYPNMDMFLRQNFSSEDLDPYDIVVSCVDKIVNGEEVYESSDCSKKEMLDFIESMTSDQFMEVNKFFTTMPKLQHPVVLHNNKTGVDNELTLEGLGDFFG
jgi:hypothetical protein